MPTGTLCVSKISAKFETYSATFVPYDGTLPSSVTLHGFNRLQSILEEAGGRRSDRTRTLSDAMTLGVVILSDVDMTAETLRARASEGVHRGTQRLVHDGSGDRST